MWWRLNEASFWLFFFFRWSSTSFQFVHFHFISTISLEKLSRASPLIRVEMAIALSRFSRGFIMPSPGRYSVGMLNKRPLNWKGLRLCKITWEKNWQKKKISSNVNWKVSQQHCYHVSSLGSFYQLKMSMQLLGNSPRVLLSRDL